LSETLHGRCAKLAKNTRAATQADVAALSSAVCHGFEPSCIWLKHRTVVKIRVDIDELRGDDFRAGQPDGTTDGFRVDVGYRWKRSDGSEVVGALRSTNCSKVLCQHCRHLDKNISFVRAVRAHLDANDRGLQRGERTSDDSVKLGKLTRNELEQTVRGKQEKLRNLRFEMWSKLRRLVHKCDTQMRRAEQAKELPEIGELWRRAVERGTLQPGSAAAAFLLQIVRNLARMKIGNDGRIRRQGRSCNSTHKGCKCTWR
jgi:hypothetical protein